MTEQFFPSVMPPEGPAQPALWFIFRGTQLLTTGENGRSAIPHLLSPADLGLTTVRWQYHGHLDDSTYGPAMTHHCFCGEVAEETVPPPGMSFENLRALFPRLDETAFWLAGRAIQIIDWDRTHQYCGRCGTAMTYQIQERAKVCPACGLSHYPRLAPAVIVRVERNDGPRPRILLARAQRFPTGMFSVLAGFVEPGETLEECVRREVREEVGLAVSDIRYFGSQPWPFPHSLMVGFIARWVAGEIVVDTTELAEADWFTADTLPRIPPPPSIANSLITRWRDELGL